jgi:hypothetical protein
VRLVLNGPIYLFIKTWALLMAKRLYVFIGACFVDPLVLGLVGLLLDTLVPSYEDRPRLFLLLFFLMWKAGAL